MTLVISRESVPVFDARYPRRDPTYRDRVVLDYEDGSALLIMERALRQFAQERIGSIYEAQAEHALETADALWRARTFGERKVIR